MDGVLIVDKPKGMTSHDVVNKLRHILMTKKIGHTGTLDPDATGLMIVLIGKATKILPFIEDTDKEYIASMALGKKTQSDDASGIVLDTKMVTPITDFQVILDSFKGKIKQYPPIISSIKVNGKKLYEYARKGEAVEIPEREVEVYDIECIDANGMTFRVHCSKGFYVRSLCRDIAERTGNYGYMTSLRRTKIGRFSLQDAYSLDQIKNNDFTLHSINTLLSHLPMIEYDKINDVMNGKRIKIDILDDTVVITKEGECIAIYGRETGSQFRCIRGLF